MQRKKFLGKRSRSSSIDFMWLNFMERAWMSYAKKRWA
jgi:hypothetical protein